MNKYEKAITQLNKIDSKLNDLIYVSVGELYENIKEIQLLNYELKDIMSEAIDSANKFADDKRQEALKISIENLNIEDLLEFHDIDSNVIAIECKPMTQQAKDLLYEKVRNFKPNRRKVLIGF